MNKMNIRTSQGVRFQIPNETDTIEYELFTNSKYSNILGLIALKIKAKGMEPQDPADYVSIDIFQLSDWHGLRVDCTNYHSHGLVAVSDCSYTVFVDSVGIDWSYETANDVALQKPKWYFVVDDKKANEEFREVAHEVATKNINKAKEILTPLYKNTENLGYMNDKFNISSDNVNTPDVTPNMDNSILQYVDLSEYIDSPEDDKDDIDTILANFKNSKS